jgi:hypothetical protein
MRPPSREDIKETQLTGDKEVARKISSYQHEIAKSPNRISIHFLSERIEQISRLHFWNFNLLEARKHGATDR